jgi:thiol-disulfide isomerase/thioredoxin
MSLKSVLLTIVLVSYVLGTSAQRKGTIPEVSLKDTANNIVKLSSLKGKVVLIDFWASWCGPCRIANKQLVKLYNKYKDKGFEIYSISCDYTKPAWLNAIKVDKLTWTQVYDDGGNVANTWGIAYLPMTFLIDKEGKVVAYELHGNELERQLKKLL